MACQDSLGGTGWLCKVSRRVATVIMGLWQSLPYLVLHSEGLHEVALLGVKRGKRGFKREQLYCSEGIVLGGTEMVVGLMMCLT